MCKPKLFSCQRSDCAQRSRIYVGLELEFRLLETVAKFIIKSSSIVLLLNKVFSAGTTAETCTTAYY